MPPRNSLSFLYFCAAAYQRDLLKWCPERGLNPYAPIKGRRILSPLRLPVSPSGRVGRPGIMRSTRRTSAQETRSPGCAGASLDEMAPAVPASLDEMVPAVPASPDEMAPAVRGFVRSGGATRSRTGLDGFAIRCITALLSRRMQGSHCGKKKGSSRLPCFSRSCSCGRAIWSGKGGSNSRPQPWQGCALPTELFPRREPHTITEVLERINGAAHPVRLKGQPRVRRTRPPRT